MSRYLCPLFLLVLTGCFKHVQTHGDGPFLKDTVVYEESDKHWYILWGNVDLSPVDIDAKVKEHPDCRVTTEQTPVDWFIGLFTGAVTINPRSVTFEIPVAKDSAKGREVIEAQRKKAMQQAAREAERNRRKESGAGR